MDLLRPKASTVDVTRTALEEARNPSSGTSGAVSALIQKMLTFGIDGRGPIDSASQVAQKALLKSGGDPERAIGKVISSHVRGGGIGGFVTSIGGFVTMAVALPVNVLEFYTQATHMVSSIAELRGYDTTSAEVRTAVLLTLVGSKSDDILLKAGVSVGGGRLASLALQRLPASAIMIINKAVGFRLLRVLAGKTISRLGRAVPLLGGVVGAGVDMYMMRKFADQALREFPQAR